jgi:hypothetical protein
VCTGDLAGGALVVVADVGRGIAASVLELYLKTLPKLLNVESRRTPVDPDVLADAPRVVG